MLICSGKLAYELEAAGASERVAVVRLEQYYPLPEAELLRALRAHRGAEVVWVQEEPENFGAAAWLRRRLERLIGAPVGLIARPESPSPAGSFHGAHDADQARLVERATTLAAGRRRRAA